MPSAIRIKELNAFYGEKQALYEVNLDIPKNKITAFIGPSGCGKTTLLRTINRLNDLKPSYKARGTIEMAGQNILDLVKADDIAELRMKIGMVFQQANILPVSIFKNMALPLKEHYKVSQKALEDHVLEQLRAAGLYEEVKTRLNCSALTLSGGQQQRLCIARALMLKPQVLLLDEPCSALDPISTAVIEDLLVQLSEFCTIVIVTHNMEQAARIAHKTAFFYNGSIVEEGDTETLFVAPKTELCSNYISGKA